MAKLTYPDDPLAWSYQRSRATGVEVNTMDSPVIALDYSGGSVGDALGPLQTALKLEDVEEIHAQGFEGL